jgi:RIO-like serine/threonine protein kinase
MSSQWEEWVPSKAVEELTLKRALSDVEDPLKLAADLFRESLPLAVIGLTHTAIYEPNVVVRTAAQKYVIDRSMGTTAAPSKIADDKPAWERIFESVAAEAEHGSRKE